MHALMTYALKKVQICCKNMHLYFIFLHKIFICKNIFTNTEKAL